MVRHGVGLRRWVGERSRCGLSLCHVACTAAVLTAALALTGAGCGSSHPLAGPSAQPIVASRATTLPTPVALETIPAGVVGQLVASRVLVPPAMDGEVDATWQKAVPLQLPLTWGSGGTELAHDLELRALYTQQALYLLAAWPAAPPGGSDQAIYNTLTVHWDIPSAGAGARQPACSVACHAAYANGAGRWVSVSVDTIPMGSDASLPVAGGWHDGIWTLEYSRALVDGNPFDLQFAQLDRSYSFFVKVFAHVEGRPDLVSRRCALVFEP
jgi:hypothetical protein